MVKNLPYNAVLDAGSISGQEDTLEGKMTTNSNILAWEFPWTEEPGWLQSFRSQKSQTQLKRPDNYNKSVLS